MQLIFGAHKIERVVGDVDRLLLSDRSDDGYHYLDYQLTSAGSRIVPEDLAVTLLVNSRRPQRAAVTTLQGWADFHSLRSG